MSRRQPVSEWKQLFLHALAESKSRTALLRIEEARAAIQRRLVEVRCTEPPEALERREIAAALYYLRLLQDKCS
jgi:hypothetical protein